MALRFKRSIWTGLFTAPRVFISSSLIVVFISIPRALTVLSSYFRFLIAFDISHCSPQKRLDYPQLHNLLFNSSGSCNVSKYICSTWFSSMSSHLGMSYVDSHYYYQRTHWCGYYGTACCNYCCSHVRWRSFCCHSSRQQSTLEHENPFLKTY